MRAISWPPSARGVSPSSTMASARRPDPEGRRRASSRPGLGAKPSSGSRADRRTWRAKPRASGGWASSVPPRERWASRAPKSDSSRVSMTAEPSGRLGARLRNRCSPVPGSARKDTVKAPALPRAPANRAAASRRDRASSREIPGGGDSRRIGRSWWRSVTSISPGVHTAPRRSTSTGASIRRTPGVVVSMGLKSSPGPS